MIEQDMDFETKIKLEDRPGADRHWWFHECRKDPYAPGEHKFAPMPDDISIILESGYKIWLDSGKSEKNSVFLISPKYCVHFGEMKQYYIADTRRNRPVKRGDMGVRGARPTALKFGES